MLICPVCRGEKRLNTSYLQQSEDSKYRAWEICTTCEGTGKISNLHSEIIKERSDYLAKKIIPK